MLNLLKKYWLILVMIGLTACGGGGSGGNNSPVTPTTSQVSMDPSAGGVANGASNVSLTPTFVLKFANPMVASSINATTIQLAPVSTQSSHQTTTVNNIVLGNFTANADNTLFTFTSLTPLNPATGYSLAVGNGAQTVTGTNISGQFSFTTGNYAIPTVALVSPGNNATGISTTPTIQLQFNEAMQNVTPANVTLHEESAGGTTVAISSITAGANNNYTFSPTESLNEQTSYYVVLTNQITDTDGDRLVPVTFNFTTGDFSFPVASILYPSNNAIGVSANPSLQIHFSKMVTGINTNNITLHVGSVYGPTVAIESITAGDNNSYSITPVTLNSLTTYYLDLSSNISDSGGHSLTFTSFNFTTGDFSTPTAIMLSPSNNATKVHYGASNFSIVIQFSKPVQNVNINTITVYVGSPSSGSLAQIDNIDTLGNNVYNIYLHQYNPQTQYFVVLSNGISDNYSNALVPITFSFTTDLELGGIQNLAFHDQSLYIVNLTNSVTECAVESSTGSLSNCQYTTDGLHGSSTGIAFDNNYAYVSSSSFSSNIVFKCTVNDNGGLPYGCTSAITSLHSLALDLEFNNSILYIVNYANNQVTQCSLDSGGLLINCAATGTGFNVPMGIAFANSYAYIANANESNATVSQCSITGNGQFGSCNSTGSNFDSPVKIAINGNYAYVANIYSSTVTQCSINSVNGNLTNCTKIGNPLFNYPVSIKFNNGYAYIAEYNNNTITKCTVNNANGSFSNCTTM